MKRASFAVLTLAVLFGFSGAAADLVQRTRREAYTLPFEKGLYDKNGIMSIPQNAPDPEERAMRLSWRARFWQAVPWNVSVAPGLLNTTFCNAGGVLGQGTIALEVQQFTNQITQVQSVGNAEMYTPMTTKCAQLGGPTLNCLKTLSSYKELYDVLKPFYKPAAVDFYLSDEAFARERLTTSPRFVVKVTDVSELPPESSIVGLDTITQDRSLASLVASGKVLKVDFSDYYQKGLLQTSIFSVLEVPIAFFIFDTKNVLRPLCIQYQLTNTNVYSPYDPPMDWHLAKTTMNALELTMHAVEHIVTHFVLISLYVAAEMTLAAEHPVYAFIKLAVTRNLGIINAGVLRLFSPNGTVDQVLFLNGPKCINELIPYWLNAFTWDSFFLEADLEARGVESLPNFPFRDDARALYKALSRFARGTLSLFYPSTASIQGDTELKAFVDLLSSDPSLKTYLKGFPAFESLTKTGDVSTFVAQVLWLSGVQHHALNTNKLAQHDRVVPSHSGKIFKAAPATKGQLNETTLVKDYIAGSTALYPLPFQFFIATQAAGQNYLSLLQKPERLSAFYFTTADDLDTLSKVISLRNELYGISKRINARETAVASQVPAYLLLDPQRLPFFSWV